MALLSTRIDLYKQMNNCLKSQLSQFSSIPTTYKVLTTFSKNSKNPLVIQGRLLTAGTYKDSRVGELTLTPEVLQASLDQWRGIPIYTTHNVFRDIVGGKDPDIRSIAGRIVDVEWNSADSGIDFTAEISNSDVTELMAAQLIKFISAGFLRNTATEMISGKWMNFARDLKPVESSLVYDPRDPKASYKVVA